MFKSDPVNDRVVEWLSEARTDRIAARTTNRLTISGDFGEYVITTAEELDRLLELAGYGLMQIKFIEAMDSVQTSDDPNRAFAPKDKK